MSPRIVVIGAGVAGLAAANAIRRAAPEVDVVVLEAQARVGGLVETVRTPGGFLIEHGADCLMTTKPRGLAAVQAAGLDEEIVVGSGSRQSYIAGHDGLVPSPPVLGAIGPGEVWSFLRSPLLSYAGKARAALEPLVRARRDAGDESVGAFAVRRFGRELAGAVFDPLIGGVYGADTSRLSVDACLPRLRDFEREHGSVTMGMRRAMRARRRRVRAGEVVLPPVVTLRRGMGSLPDALVRGLEVTCGVTVDYLAREGNGFRIETTRGPIRCDGVVLATPAWRIPPMVEGLAPDLAVDLAAIPHKAIDCVTLAWQRREVPHALDGTGWVRAVGDSRSTLACTWASQKWPDRAPSGFVLVRSVLSLPTVVDDGDLVVAARADLRDLVGVTAWPAFALVRRLPHATPIYEVGHATRVARLEAHARELGAFALAGNAYRGVGVPDCVASGEDAARVVLAALPVALWGTAPAPALTAGM